jgi:hypothetical protein
MGTRLDGQIVELETGGYEVILRKNAPVTRKRFTLAHEIAHTLLLQDQSAEGLSRREQMECGGVIEELCNIAAAEMLIPDRMLQKMFLKPKGVTVKSFLKVSRSFDCSLEASGWKLLNSGLIEGALLIWRLVREECGPILRLVAIPRTWGLQIPIKKGMMLDPRHSLWEGLTAEELGSVELKDFCRGASYRGQCYRVGKTILVLVKIGENYNQPVANKPRSLVSRGTQDKLPF